jgi:hypothetical protein
MIRTPHGQVEIMVFPRPSFGVAGCGGLRSARGFSSWKDFEGDGAMTRETFTGETVKAMKAKIFAHCQQRP